MTARVDPYRTSPTSHAPTLSRVEPVKALLTAADGSLLEFVEEPEADEWHQSMNARRQRGGSSWAAAAQSPEGLTPNADSGAATAPAATGERADLFGPPTLPPTTNGSVPPPPGAATPAG